MLVDYHSHVLPGLDDGADAPEAAISMLKMMKAQGIQIAVATPHFYAHRQNRDICGFLHKRDAAWQSVANEAASFPQILFGAEVSIERGISEMEGLSQLCITGTDLILLEFPYSGFEDWMLAEIENITFGLHLQPVLVHVHRYCNIFSKSQLAKIESIPAILQVNQEAFQHFRQRQMVKRWMKDERTLIFGTDSHNLKERAPQYSLITNGLKHCPQLLEQAGEILQQHTLIG